MNKWNKIKLWHNTAVNNQGQTPLRMDPVPMDVVPVGKVKHSGISFNVNHAVQFLFFFIRFFFLLVPAHDVGQGYWHRPTLCDDYFTLTDI